MKKTCNTCEWFVEEDETMNYSHREAKKNSEGFCLVKDFFTCVEANFQACKAYQEENNKE